MRGQEMRKGEKRCREAKRRDEIRYGIEQGRDGREDGEREREMDYTWSGDKR